ncbi:hypothetical protein [Paenibacillus sp. FSL W8-0194]|uniref:hypothetical protein n=1 Tax=Paenibacillus sp. FSL W8-0194 TaxID=2921711 RepID=UPI0030DAB6DF
MPAKRFAKMTVQGNRTRMEEAYDALFKWFAEGAYVRDTRDGSFGFEMNRLHPLNPFDIPADEIDDFDFDIFAPILTEQRGPIQRM